MSDQHSPLPWTNHNDLWILDANDKIVAELDYNGVISVPDTALILRAVNNHARLVAALREARECAEWHLADGDECGETARAVVARIDAILADCEKESSC